MKNYNIFYKILIVTLIIFLLSFITVKFNSLINNPIKAYDNLTSIVNNLDLSTYDYYGNFLSLDKEKLTIQITDFNTHKHKINSFDISRSNIITMEEKIEYNNSNSLESMYIVYKKVNPEELIDYLSSNTKLRIWASEGLATTIVIELN